MEGLGFVSEAVNGVDSGRITNIISVKSFYGSQLSLNC